MSDYVMSWDAGTAVTVGAFIYSVDAGEYLISAPATVVVGDRGPIRGEWGIADAGTLAPEAAPAQYADTVMYFGVLMVACFAFVLGLAVAHRKPSRAAAPDPLANEFSEWDAEFAARTRVEGRDPMPVPPTAVVIVADNDGIFTWKDADGRATDVFGRPRPGSGRRGHDT